MITTGEAALFGAGAALSVAIIDRLIASLVVERRSQRNYRREVYGRFMASIGLARSYLTSGNSSSERAVQVAHDIAQALAEVQLAGPEQIILCAQEIVDAMTGGPDGQPNLPRVQAGQDRFLEFARKDTK